MSRFHQSPEWRAVRLAVLRRDFYRCRVCGRAGALEVDHITPRVDGGAKLDPANLQTICRGCHIAKTKAEALARLPPAVRRWREVVAEYP